jgi:hypothetical protein
MLERWEWLCAIAVTCFSLSGALIMQMPCEDRRTLFIFRIFLAVVVGGGLVVFGYERFGARIIAGPLLVPIMLAQVAGRRLRQRLRLSREQFPTRYGFEIETVRNWETGKREPDATTRSYLRAIANAPEVVEEAFAPTPALH